MRYKNIENEETSKRKKQIYCHVVDAAVFKVLITKTPPPVINQEINVDILIDEIDNRLYHTALQSSKTRQKSWNMELTRWQRLLDQNDPKIIWHAIDSKGKLPPQCPNDEFFKDHFENLLFINNLVDDVDLTDCPFIPEWINQYPEMSVSQ